MKKNLLMRVSALCLTIMLILSQTALAAGTSDKDLEYLKSVMEMIKEKYKDEVSDKELIEGALKGMFNTMDAYTVYYSPKEAKEFLGEVEGKYEGIGVMMNKSDDNSILISNVFSGSPAEKAGIIAGDRIVSVDGRGVASASLDQVVTWIRGTAGTEVSLGVIKAGRSDITVIKVTRAEIKINPIHFEIRNGIGYIKIASFNSNTREYINEALNVMDNNGVDKLVLDLRNNPGGEVSQAVEVAKRFVPEGLITKLNFKSEKYADESYFSTLKSPKYKLAVLVNEMSASASEIVAGAIQDTKAGTLIGTKTFGKARVQVLIPLLTPEAYEKYEKQLGIKVLNAYDLINLHGIMPENSEIIGWTKITVGEYITPKGRMIDKTGIEPDIKVENYKPAMDIDVNSIQKLAKASKPALNSDSPDVYNAEKILKLAGYDVDKPDTKLDSKTFEAIKKFQKDNGGYPYGVLDFTTQSKLNEMLDKLILEIDKQYAKAVEILK